jgi:hypothetical protein
MPLTLDMNFNTLGNKKKNNEVKFMRHYIHQSEFPPPSEITGGLIRNVISPNKLRSKKKNNKKR